MCLNKIILPFTLFVFSSFVFSDIGLDASTSENQPAALIQVAPNYRYTLISELEEGKLHIFEKQLDNSFQLIKTMEVSIGKSGYGKQVEGDNKTPIGIYRITSHLTEEQLDDFYGNAAYPINYPNAWDRLNERTGYGIWLHAEPIGYKEKTRPLLDSNGCVVLSNNDIDILKQYLDVGYTYIVLTPRMEMTTLQNIHFLRGQLKARLEGWRDAWESLNSQNYLDFYSKEFNSLERNWSNWVSYKKRINQNKKFINVVTSDVGIYQYPGEQGLVWIEFYQDYKSSNYQSVGWKRQLWKKEEDDVWRIIYEGGG